MEKVTKKREVIIGFCVVIFTIFYSIAVKILKIDDVAFYHDIYLIIISIISAITIFIARKQERNLYIFLVFDLVALVLSLIIVI